MGRGGGCIGPLSILKPRSRSGASCLAAFECGARVNSQLEILTFSLDKEQESIDRGETFCVCGQNIRTNMDLLVF